MNKLYNPTSQYSNQIADSLDYRFRNQSRIELTNKLSTRLSIQLDDQLDSEYYTEIFDQLLQIDYEFKLRINLI